MNAEPTIQDVLEAIADFSSRVDERFDGVDKRFQGVDARFDRLELRVGKVESEIVGMKSDITSMKSDVVGLKNQMVTKSYLDDKLADLRGDLVALTSKMNVKLSVLVERLVKDGSLKRKTADLILAMEPFAQG